MLRRQFLASTAALVLVGCTSGTDTVTVQSIVDWLKDKCQFVTGADQIIAVIVTLVTGFNASAGAGAAVAAAVAKQVEDLVCNAVKLQAAQLKAATPGSPTRGITVVVNGVTVSGDFTG